MLDADATLLFDIRRARGIVTDVAPRWEAAPTHFRYSKSSCPWTNQGSKQCRSFSPRTNDEMTWRWWLYRLKRLCFQILKSVTFCGAYTRIPIEKIMADDVTCHGGNCINDSFKTWNSWKLTQSLLFLLFYGDRHSWQRYKMLPLVDQRTQNFLLEPWIAIWSCCWCAQRDWMTVAGFAWLVVGCIRACFSLQKFSIDGANTRDRPSWLLLLSVGTDGGL